MQEIRKIVITGGPCAGKTTAIRFIRNEFEARGYTILVVSESATELISNGMSPKLFRNRLDYQLIQIQHQLSKEKLFYQSATVMSSSKVLIVCDRGIFDGKAYCSAEDFSSILSSLKQNEDELFSSYDAVFHILTTAKGSETFYSTANNAVRGETVLQAIDLDNRLLDAWASHPYVRIISNYDSFDRKLNQLIEEIAEFLI